MKRECLYKRLWIVLILSFSVSAKIEVSGVDSEIKDNILAYLQVSDAICSRSTQQPFLDSIATKVKKAVRPFGYYQAKVIVGSELDSKGCLDIKIAVQLGAPLILRNLNLQIFTDTAHSKHFQSFIEKSGLKQGQKLIQSEYETLKLKLSEQANELGFIDAQFSVNEIHVYPGSAHADINLVFETGPRYLIEKIEIDQKPGFLDESFICNMLDIKTNSYFSKTDLYQVRKRLLSTGYFQQVRLELDEENRNNSKVSLRVYLTPGDRIKYSAGLGFSTDSGPRVRLDYQHNRITNYGYQWNSDLNLSNIISEFTLGLKVPSRQRALNKWSNFDLGFRVERSDAVTSDTLKLGWSETRMQFHRWQNVNFFDLINEKFETGDQLNESTLLVPGTSWSYIQSDNPVRPQNGFKAQLELKGASKTLVSDTSFLQLSVGIKDIHSWSEDYRLISRLDLSTTYTEDFELLPSSFRSYAGGDQSIRGFSFQELGPIDSNGDVIGGKHLAVASVELEKRITGPWAAAVFIDMGNAFTDEFEFEKSAGLGLRWFSPVGPIRLDLGFPINHERDFKFHITLGPDL